MIDIPKNSDKSLVQIELPTKAILPARFTEETLINLRYWTPTLLTFRISRYAKLSFTPGHYARLGLKNVNDDLVWRPYSVVSSQLDGHLEFIATLIPNGEFSNLLAKSNKGDTVLVDKNSYGFMTIDGFAPGKDLWLLASGTGLGPFISILRDAATWKAYQNVVLVHSVRYEAELAYREEINALIQSHAPDKRPTRLRYIPVVTRELVSNISSKRIPQLIEEGQLELAAGLLLDSAFSRIMVCGNPQMLSELRGIFTTKGFHTNRRALPGQIAFENYWLNKP